MLVLTRRPKQSIMIGDDIEIAVLAVSGDKVRLGITAPRSIGVYRSEIYAEIVQDRADEQAPAQQAAIEHGST